MNEEVRRSVTIKMKPSIVKKARVGAVISEKTLGEWLEGAVEEKAAREKGQEAQLKWKRPVSAGLFRA